MEAIFTLTPNRTNYEKRKTNSSAVHSNLYICKQ